MNRAEIKEKAKKIIDGKLWVIWKPILLTALISAFLVFLLNKVFVVAYSYEVLSINGTSFAIDLSNTIITFIMTPISVGYVFYILKLVRGKEPSINDIFSKMKYFFPIWAVTFIASVLIGVGFMVLIFPGVIISMMLAMVEYIMADGETNVLKVLKKSKDMMNGYKWDLFVFGLSFLGWIFLGIITFGMAFIYITPYMNVSYALYYEELKKKHNKD